MIFDNKIIQGNALTELQKLPSEFIDCIISSPPYYQLRDYKHTQQIGNEETIDEYIDKLIQVFDECKRVLKRTGTCFIVIADSHNDNKSLSLVPERFSIKMTDHDWILRNIIIWKKPNCMPSSVKDRFTIDYEFIQFYTKSKKYYFKTQYEPLSEITIKEVQKFYNGRGKKDYAGNGIQNPSEVKRRIIKKFAPIGGVKHVIGNENPTYSGNGYNPNIEQGRIKRSIWNIKTQSFSGLHYAVFPEELVKNFIDCGCPENGIVLDLFLGSGTTALVVLKNNRRFVGIELNEDYIQIAMKRLNPYLKTEKIDSFIV